MKTSFVVPALFVFFLIGCDKREPEPPLTLMPYWKIGNTWSYEVKNSWHTFSETVRLDAISRERLTFTRTSSNGDVYLQFEYYQNGFLYKQAESSPLADKYLRYGDLKVDDVWEDYYRDYEVVAQQEPVTVPAGTFSCTKVKSVTKADLITGANETSYSYYSEQHGLVKVDGMVQNLTLVSKNF